MERMTVVLGQFDLPGSFDFLWQLQNMKAVAYQEGYDTPQILFDFDTYNPPKGAGHALFLNNVIRPLMKMFGVKETKEKQGKVCYGMFYNTAGMTRYYETFGLLPFPWRVDTEAEQWAESYRGAVVITLRHCNHFPERNSNLPEWLKAAEAIRNRGERVVFVPDTAVPNPPVNDFECLPEASVDLEKRAALYAVAQANLFICNGPATLCTCTRHIPYLVIVTKAAVDQFEASDVIPNTVPEDMWKMWLGFYKGEEGPNYKGSQQLWLWDEDTCDVIVKGYDRIT
jgi:hypothetical protein